MPVDTAIPHDLNRVAPCLQKPKTTLMDVRAMRRQEQLRSSVLQKSCRSCQHFQLRSLYVNLDEARRRKPSGQQQRVERMTRNFQVAVHAETAHGRAGCSVKTGDTLICRHSDRQDLDTVETVRIHVLPQKLEVSRERLEREDATVRANQTRRQERKKAHVRANVEHNLARTHVLPEDLLRFQLVDPDPRSVRRRPRDPAATSERAEAHPYPTAFRNQAEREPHQPANQPHRVTLADYPGVRTFTDCPPRAGTCEHRAMPYKLAVIASHVIQYQDPMFRLLAAHPEIDLMVLYSSPAGAQTFRDEDMGTDVRWDLSLLQGYQHRFLPNLAFGRGYWRALNPSVVPWILFGRWDAVVLMAGWGSVTSLLAIAACRMSGTPFFLYGDSSFPPEVRSARDAMRAGFLRSLFGLASGFLVSGVLNAAYYRHYGADPGRFFLVPWAIDNDRFAAASQRSPDDRRALRESLGIKTDDVVFVYSAKLVPRKDPLTLLEAAKRVEDRDRTVVLFLGDGELRVGLEQYALENGIRAVFAGFINQGDLPAHYAAGDVFVLPSIYEPRGAVINEAMACGLPIIVSDRCGSIGDIVLEGENALVFPAGDAETLASLMKQLIDDVALRHSLGTRSREIISTWDYARDVDGILQALRATC